MTLKTKIFSCNYQQTIIKGGETLLFYFIKMTVNLNDYKDKKFITKEILKSHLKDSVIYCHYMNVTEIELNKAMLSPLRDDTTPSFGFFKNNNNEIIYNDFVKGGGDCFKFVKEMFSINRWYDVYSKIAIDFSLDKDYICNKNLLETKKETINKNVKVLSNEKCKIDVQTRRWYLHDLKYWKQYNISLKTLKKYNIFPIKYIFLQDKPISADKYAYVYYEFKDGIKSLKIYQPYSKFKWLTDNDNSVWQGWEQLKEKGDILIITKSLKDVMVIEENTEYNSISLQNEKVIPKEVIIDILKSRYKKIYVLFDNDYDKNENWGQLNALKICRDHMLENIVIPKSYKSKDISDMVKNHTLGVAIAFLKSIIK